MKITGTLVLSMMLAAMLLVGWQALTHTHAAKSDTIPMSFGKKMPDGTHYLTCTQNGTTPNGAGAWILTGYPQLVIVTGNGSTLIIPCECPAGQSGPCHAVFTWTGSSYSGTTQACAGGDNKPRKFAYNDQTDSYMEGIVEGGQIEVVGIGSRSDAP